mgnify:CR=1 FL=1
MLTKMENRILYRFDNEQVMIEPWGLDALRVRFLGKKGELTGVLKSMGKEDQANLAALAGLAIVLFMVIDLLAELFTYVKTVFLLY